MAFFTDPADTVTLIETLLWTPAAGYALRQRHLDRLAASAAYLGLTLDLAAIGDLLDAQDFAAQIVCVARGFLRIERPAARPLVNRRETI